MMIDWYMIIFSAAAILSLTVIMVSLKQIRTLRQSLTQQNEQVSVLQQDLRALYSGAVGVDERIIRLEKRIRRLVERQEQLESTQTSGRPYDQAIRMVHKGSSVEDIMSVCELTQGEADLIMMMHGMDKAS